MKRTTKLTTNLMHTFARNGLLWVAAFLGVLCWCGGARADAPCPAWTDCADGTSVLGAETAQPEPPPVEPVVHRAPPSSGVDDDEAPAPIDERNIAAWDHFEFSMGFIAGARDYSAHTYEGTHRFDPAIFAGTPFGNTEAYGLRYDVRLVVWYLRMTAGVDLPFASYDVENTRINIDGQDALVTGMKNWPFHFGIGAEYPFGPVAPFVDVLGGLSFAKPTIAMGGEEEELRGQTFGFTVRAGLRLHVRKWFFASISGEAGIVGDVQWGTELSVGFAVM